MAKARTLLPVAIVAVLLVSSVPPLAQRASASSIFSLSYSPSTVVFHYPEDVTLLRNVTVTDTGNAYYEMIIVPTFTGTDASLGNGAVYPQGAGLVLNPGQSVVVAVTMDLSRMAVGWASGQTYSYNITLDIGPISAGIGCTQPNFCIDQSRAQTAFLRNAVQVLCTCTTVPTNSTVSGTVYDRATALPIAGAVVSVQGSSFSYPAVTTNASGGYSMPVTAYQPRATGAWAPLDVHVTVPNSTFYTADAVVSPRPGGTSTQDFLLDKATQTATYKVLTQTEVAGGLNLGAGAFSGNGSYLAAVTYNPGPELPQWIAQYSSLYFFSSNGTKLWNYSTYTPTQAVDVSDDAKYVAVATGTPSSTITQLADIFNTAGNLVWSLNATSVPGSVANLSLYWTPDQWTSLKFSHADGFLAAGTRDGFVYLMSMATRQVVWEKFLGGSIGPIRFSPDDSVIYVSSDSGYLYAFGTTSSGDKFWKTGTFTGASSLSFSGNYIVVSDATGDRVMLIDLSGNVAWSSPVGAAYDIVRTSPNQQFVAFFGNAPYPYSGLMLVNGSLQTLFGPASTGTISHDSNYVLWAGLVQGEVNEVSFVLYDTSGHALMNLTDSANIVAGCGGGPSYVGSLETRIVLVMCDYVFVLGGYVTTTYDNPVPYGTGTQDVQVASNSTISNLAYDPSVASISFSSSLSTGAMFNVTIPSVLMQGAISVSAGGAAVDASIIAGPNSTNVSFVCSKACGSVLIAAPPQTTTTTTSTTAASSSSTSTATTGSTSTSTATSAASTTTQGGVFKPTSILLIEILGIALVALAILLVQLVRRPRKVAGVPSAAPSVAASP